MSGDLPKEPEDGESSTSAAVRARRYWAVARQKREDALRNGMAKDYYTLLIAQSMERTDVTAVKDRKQVGKDLSRTFGVLPVSSCDLDAEHLQPMLSRILFAYVERGRALCATSMVLGVATMTPSVATTSRGLLTNYPQGLNFLAGMCLLASLPSRASASTVEETAFWLLALLLEDVLDPDFFGAAAEGHMSCIGGLGMRDLIAERAQDFCPKMLEALGPEVFRSSLMTILNQWVLSLFIGCAPPRLLEYLWDHLLLPSPYHPSPLRSREGRSVKAGRLPRGLNTVVSFALAALQCCGEEQLRGTQELDRLRGLNDAGAGPEYVSLEAGEAIGRIKMCFLSWPESEDRRLLDTATRILFRFSGQPDSAENTGAPESASGKKEVSTVCDFDEGAAVLWEDVRVRKQRIADCTGDLDQQLMALQERTHFNQQDIERLRDEFKKILQQRGGSSARSSNGCVDDKATGCSLETFKEVVHRAVPQFPPELCSRLFRKLDAFQVGHLTFVELMCGMSALSLGSVDEKLQVCFDLFDSEGRKALTLKDTMDLCSVLFRVALSHGVEGARRTKTTEDLIEPLARSRVRTLQACSPRLLPMASFPSEPLGGLKTEGPGGASGPVDGGPLAPAEPNTYIGHPGSAIFGGQICTARSNPPCCSSSGGGLSASEIARQQPWRALLLQLLPTARVHVAGGPKLIAFEDFHRAALRDPALLCLFAWCVSPAPFGVPSFWDPLRDRQGPCMTLYTGLIGLIRRCLSWCDRRRRQHDHTD